MLAFGLAALAAAFFLLGQSIARYISATVADLQLLRAPGMTPRQAIAAACAAPFLAAMAGTAVGVAGAIVASAVDADRRWPRCSSRTRGSARTG